MTDSQIAAKVRTHFGEQKNGQDGRRNSHRRSNKLTHNRAVTDGWYTPEEIGHDDND
jgi:hypothetical protein